MLRAHAAQGPLGDAERRADFRRCANSAPAEPGADPRSGPQCPGAEAWPAQSPVAGPADRHSTRAWINCCSSPCAASASIEHSRPNFGQTGGGPMELAQLPAQPPAEIATILRRMGTANAAPLNARPYRARSWAGNQMEPQRQGPSVRACARWPGPRVMISPARIPIPPQIGAGPLPIGNETRIRSAGTATKAIRDSCSSAADRRRRCSVTWVSRARNWPRPVISRPRHALLAQGGLEIVRFAEHRRDAARHFLIAMAVRGGRADCRRYPGQGAAVSGIDSEDARARSALAIQFWQKRGGGRRNAQRRHPRANAPVRYCRLSGCAALDNAIEGVVVINFPDDRN